MRITLFTTSFFLFCLLSDAFSQSVSPDSIRQYFYTQTYLFPQEKIYAQTDRSSYLINDTIWFRAYLVNAQSHLPDPESNFVYSELIDPFNNVVKRVKVKKEEDAFSGFLPLDEEISAGIYVLRFYTSYMTNGNEHYFFSKNIRIGNFMSAKYRSTARSIQGGGNNTARAELRLLDNSNAKPVLPDELYIHDEEGNRNKVSLSNDTVINIRYKPSEIRSNVVLIEYLLDGYVQKEFVQVQNDQRDYTVSFFPEGGNLLYGTVNRVAFKAMNSSGLAEEVTGAIVNGAGDSLATFRTTHLGMGFVTLNIQDKEPLYAVCRNADGNEKRVELPMAENDAFSLRTDWRNDHLLVSINSSWEEEISEKIYLLLHCRGTVLYSEEWNAQRTMIGFPANELPSGVLHVMLLDEQLNPVSERLVFNQNVADIANATLTTDKNSYTTRDNVIASVSIVDANGSPQSGSFSVSVTDKGIIQPDSTMNILSTLLLTSDLQGHIESAADYFKEGILSRLNLDVLMMTQGWRRYNVNKILKRAYVYPERGMEISQEISGNIWRGINKNRKANTYPVLLFALDHGQTTEEMTDDQGHFVFRKLSFPDSTRFVVQAQTPSGNNDVKVEVQNDFFAPVENVTPSPLIKQNHGTISGAIEDEDFFVAINQKSNLMSGIRHYQLEEVVVTARRKQAEDQPRHWATSAFSRKVTSKEIEQLRPSTMLELLMLTPGLELQGDQVYISRYNNMSSQSVPIPTIIVDGMETLSQHLNSFMPQNVETIEVLYEPQSFVLGTKGLGGAIIITTKRGGTPSTPINSDNIAYITPLGYQVTKEFYSPRYTTAEKIESDHPDERTTLYWHPNIQLSKDGKGTFDFYTSDSEDGFSVVIEGITSDGKIIHEIVEQL